MICSETTSEKYLFMFIYDAKLTWAKGVTMKSSPVCLRETGNRGVKLGNDADISSEKHKRTLPLLTHSFCVSLAESHPSLVREELRETVLGDMS